VSAKDFLNQTRIYVINLYKLIYELLTSYNTVRISIIALIVVYLPLLITALCVAIVAPIILPGIYTAGIYTMVTHFVSHLGSNLYTPAPFLFNVSCIIGGILTILLAFYVEKILAPIPEKTEEIRKIFAHRIRIQLASIGFLFGFIASIGFLFIGIFSEDGILFIHVIAALMAFYGFELNALLFGILILGLETPFPKIIGLYGIAMPVVLNFILAPLTKYLIPVLGFLGALATFEWIMYFMIMAWIMSLVFVIIFKKNHLERRTNGK